MGNSIKINDIVCANVLDYFVKCVHCKEDTYMTTQRLQELGNAQFCCNICGKGATYRYGEFPSNIPKYIPPVIEAENWEQLIIDL